MTSQEKCKPFNVFFILKKKSFTDTMVWHKVFPGESVTGWVNGLRPHSALSSLPPIPELCPVLQVF